MNILKRGFILPLILCGWMVSVLGCSSSASPSPEIIASPTAEEQNVVTVQYPGLHLSNNGSVALLDTINSGFQVYTIPTLELRFGEASYEDIFDIVLSSSGTTVGIWTMMNELIVIEAEQRHLHTLPHDRTHIRSVAVADAGDQVALLVAVTSPSLEDDAENDGALEIWSLPPGNAPLASIDVPISEFEGTVVANGPFSTFAVRLGNDQFTAVYTWAGASDEVSLLWEEVDPAQSPADLALYKDWVWAVQDEGLLGWYKTDPPIQLAGTLRDRLRFSPSGDYLLAYRVEENVDLMTANILFRLIDLTTQDQVKQTTHLVKDRINAHFILADDLSLFELRLTGEIRLEVKELGW